MPNSTTLRELLEFLAPSLARRETPPPWPPDAFGLAAAVLAESGAYLAALDDWPPGPDREGHAPEQWSAELEKVGRRWRDCFRDGAPPPRQVFDWWKTIWQHGDLPLERISREREVVCALLQILAAADEASYDIGVPQKKQVLEEDPFGIQAEVTLLPRPESGSTLCREIHPSKLRVLPKFHTPQTGLTIRSLSLHLALWTGADVTPLWFTANLPRLLDATADEEDTHSINLLLIPWPDEVTPRHFKPVKPACGRIRNMAKEKFGFFSYQRDPDPGTKVDRVAKIYEAAERFTEHIDGVVLPELALEESEYKEVRRWVTGRKSILISGVGTADEGDQPGRNRVRIEVPAGDKSPDGSPDGAGRGHLIRSFQDKHHRWRLDRAQIVQYGLGGQLDPARCWWEHMEARDRHLTFVSLQPWLSLCALVCEDLARQDPVGRLVRAVGPNLVIALLMDGPQLKSRWPARYATVLADDPGSSVLSLTSIGMCEMSRPPGRSSSRVIGLWKDAHSGEAVEIELPKGADAVLLNLVRQWNEEWTADGRSDAGWAGYPALAGIHPVRVQREGA